MNALQHGFVLDYDRHFLPDETCPELPDEQAVELITVSIFRVAAGARECVGVMTVFDVCVGGHGPEITEIFSEEANACLFPLIDEPMSEDWPISKRLDTMLHKGGGYCGSVLVITAFRLSQEWRGQGIGRWALATTTGARPTMNTT